MKFEIDGHQTLNESERLETPEDSLGHSVFNCPSAVKHEPNWSTISGHILETGTSQALYVVDATCKHCGMSGSRVINPNSFNWD